jgi:hypothetical protein
MAKPKIFVSSTYYDLKHIRSSLEDFIKGLGYESILSEKGNISYEHTKPIDISCYREALNSDIFVLIIGGRYGSPSSEEKTIDKNFFEKYESVTKEEYNVAVQGDIPTYILIDKSVYSEYQTYKQNRENTTIAYVHVDSINIFHFIDEILNQPKNNAMHQFEKDSEIKEWLREQWAGLFRELLHNKNKNDQYNSLNEKIEELSSINTSMKNYLESIISKSDNSNADNIIQIQKEREEKEKLLRELYKIPLFSRLISDYNAKEEEVLHIYSTSNSVKNFLEQAFKISTLSEHKNIEELTQKWKEEPNFIKSVNKIRTLLKKDPLNFE